MPLEDTVQRILSSHPGLTREEVLGMIEEKVKDAKGFLTRESAARAVAAELGVEPEKVSFKRKISISDLISGLSNVTVTGRVIFVYPLLKFTRSDGTEGKVRRLFVADRNGEMKAVLWDSKADLPDMEKLIGQIVRFSHGYVRRGFNGRPELNMGSRGSLEIAAPNAPEEYPQINRFTKRINEITGKESNVNVLGVVGRIYPVNIFKREDGTEGKVERLELKDNSGRITVVFWNEKVDQLAKIEDEKRLGIWGAKVRESPDGRFELHVDNSTQIAFLAEKPAGFEGLSARLVKMRDLKPKMKDITVLSRVIHKGKLRKFSTQRGGKGCVSTVLIADGSGSASLNLWGDKAHHSEKIRIGDIILIEKAYTRERFGRLSLNLDTEGSLSLNPSVVRAEDLPLYKEKIVKISDLKNNNDVVSVEGTVMSSPVTREVTTSKNEKVKLASFRLADGSGEVEVSLWREAAEFAETLSVKDRIKITCAYVNRGFSGRLGLSSGPLTSLSKL